MVDQIIKRLLHVNATIEEYVPTDLPLYLKTAYDFNVMRIADRECLLAKPKEETKLVTLRKQRLQLAKHTGYECVLYFEKTTTYIKRKLTEEGVPFIIDGNDVYLPFLGVVLSNQKGRKLLVTKKIGFNTQRLLLTALYDRWNEVNVTKAAWLLGISKMTVSRCFNQIQALELPLLRETGKERRFVWEKGTSDLWQLIKPYLHNPIAKEYRFDQELPRGIYMLGGMSALCHYGMLSDNDYPTYAVTKDEIKKLNPEGMDQVPINEQPVVALQELKYLIRFKDGHAVDPVTAYMTLKEAEKQDPRVVQTFNKIMEEYVYGSGD